MVYHEMEPQLDQMFKRTCAGIWGDLGEGPMKPVDPKDVKDYYGEIERTDGPNGPVG